MKRHRVDSGYEVQDEDGDQVEESEENDENEAAVPAGVGMSNAEAGLHEDESEEGDIHTKIKNATEEIIEQLWLINHTIIDTLSLIHI